jgi:hypothetical protein
MGLRRTTTADASWPWREAHLSSVPLTITILDKEAAGVGSKVGRLSLLSFNRPTSARPIKRGVVSVES